MKIKSIALCTLLLSLTSCVSINVGKAVTAMTTTGMSALSITDAQLASYVGQSVAQMDAQNKVLPTSSPYVKRLQSLVGGLTEVDGTPLNFKVYQTSDINAFACPDGSVRVYTGIMDMMNDDELVGIIGHEVGHVMLRHSRKQIQNEIFTQAVFDGIAASNDRLSGLNQSQLAALGKQLVGARYSRSQENDADDCGYDVLAASGRNPRAMATAFGKMLALESQGSQASYITKMFSSHPETQQRIDRMTQRADKDGYPKL